MVWFDKFSNLSCNPFYLFVVLCKLKLTPCYRPPDGGEFMLRIQRRLQEKNCIK